MIKEENTSGGGEAFLSKNAFKRKKQIKEIIKQLLLKEITYNQFKKHTSATPNQKLRNSYNIINKKINEINKLLDFNIKLKEETEDKNNRSDQYLSKISEKLEFLNNKIKDKQNDR